jgi:1,4-dihydroxy-2-naphthoate octaprenyltransferase
VVCGYVYTGGPYPLAYHGLGDLFVILFFGLAATGAVFYMQTGIYSLSALIAGLQLGMHSTVMIAINNLRDHIQDAKVNKRTLAVRFGVVASKIEITCLIFIPYLLGAYWLQTEYWYAAVLSLLTLPLGIYLSVVIWQNQPSAFYNTIFGKASLHHMLFALLLGIGFFF